MFEQDRQELLNRIVKLEQKARTLAAVVRLLLALLRLSGFRLVGERLPAGVAKARVLRAITSTTPALPLKLILRILGLPPSRYHSWRSADEICGLDDRSSCPRTIPSQLTADEVAAIKDMVLDPHAVDAFLVSPKLRRVLALVEVTTPTRSLRRGGAP